MSGHREFDPERFGALVSYIIARDRAVGSLKLAWLMFHMDFDAYARLGQSLTGATYLRGDQHPEVAEVGIGWFEQAYRRTIPTWARAAGWLLTLYVLKKSLNRSVPA